MGDRQGLTRGLFGSCFLLCATLSGSVIAADDWDMQAMGQAVYGSYNDAELRDSLWGAGFFLSGDYLERGGFKVGYNYTEVEGKGSLPGAFDTLEENTFYLSGKINSYPDSLDGKLSWRLDGYLITDDVSGSVAGNGGQQGNPEIVASDADIGVINPVVTYLNNAKTYAADLGYAYSNYDYDRGGEFQAHQLTPTVGFAFGEKAHWLQLRGYFIHLSDDDANDGNSDTAAVELKWTYWLGPQAPLGVHSVGATVMAGERYLAVDPDAAVVYTLADEQQGTIALNSVWQLNQSAQIMLQVGYEQYENRVINNDYESMYVYVHLSQRW